MPDQYTHWSPPPLVIIVKNIVVLKLFFSYLPLLKMIMTPIFKMNKVFFYENLLIMSPETHTKFMKKMFEDTAPLCQNAISQIIREPALLAGMQFSNDQLSYKKTLLCCRCPTKIEYNSTYTATSW